MKQQTKIILVIALIILFAFAMMSIKNNKEDEYNNLPIKVDISMTSFYGDINSILYELDLDFDLVTMGANCYTGVQKNEFKTEKYGILYTEFRYCKSNNTTILRIYNSEEDQKLRESSEQELPKFDEYGKKINNESI